MTLVSQIITDSFRQSNLLALNVVPTSLQQTEALRYLNRIIKSTFGNEAGDLLKPFPVGRMNIEKPAGFPWYINKPDQNWFVPDNIRVMLNVDQPTSLYLTPYPNDGDRFGIVDVAGNLATNPVTIYGNGRRIENALSLTLNVNGQTGEWFYREDLGNWQRISPLLLTDVFPFPEEFDDFFITLLSLRLNPAYGATLDQQSQMILQRSKTQIRARYSQTIKQNSELALTRMTNNWVNRYYTYYDPTSLFFAGRPY